MGSVTAEFAVLLPLVVLLITVVVAAGVAALGYVRCADAARSAARLAARGESPGVVEAAVRTLGPPGARAELVRRGEQVEVRVRADVTLPLPGHPRLTVADGATARLEQP